MLALAAFALCLARGEANRGFALGLRAVRTGSPPDDDAVETALRAHDAGARGGGDAAAAARGLLERLVDGRAELAFRRRAAAARDAAAAELAAAAAGADAFALRAAAARRFAAGAAAPRRGGGWSAAAEREALAAAADALAAPRAEAAGLQSSAAEAQGRVLTGVPYSCRCDGVHADAVARRAVSRRRGERKGPPDTPHTIKTQRRSSRCTRRSSPRCSSCSSGRTRRRHR